MATSRPAIRSLPGPPRATIRAWAALPLLALALLLGGCGTVARPEGWAAPRLDSRAETIYVTLEHGKLLAARIGGPAPERLWEFPAKDQQVPLVMQQGRPLATSQSAKINFEGLYGDPVVTDDAVYATAYSGHVIALTRDGAPRWVASLSDRIIGSPLVADGTVYAAAVNGDVFAFAQDSGALRWRTAIEKSKGIWSSPVTAGGRIVVAAMNGNLYGLGRDDGAVAWTARVAEGGIAGAPAVSGARIYLGSFDRHLYALDARTGETVWQSAALDNWLWTEPLVEADRRVYAGSLGGTLYAFDAASGQTRWSQKVGDMIRGRPALVNDILVTATADGRLHGFRPDSGEQVWPAAAPAAQDSPAFARGRLYADLLGARDGVWFTTEGGRGAGKVYFLSVAEPRVIEYTLR